MWIGLQLSWVTELRPLRRGHARNGAMNRVIVYGSICTGALMLLGFAADPALAKQCRDAAGKVVSCPVPLVTKSNRCVSLKTSQPTKCHGPEAVPVVKGPIAGDPNKKPG